jgi:hypothetical protein
MNEENHPESEGVSEEVSANVSEAQSKKSRSLLGVAMMALGNLLEPGKTGTHMDTEIGGGSDPQDDILKELGISFGDLDDLDIVEES